MSDTIVFEHPLSEKVRHYLRIEYLANQIERLQSVADTELIKPLFYSLFALTEVIDRGEIKKELIKDLANQRQLLIQWRNAQNIDNNQLEQLVKQIDCFCRSTCKPNKEHIHHSSEPLLNQIKNKLALPGGGCHFDTPLLHYWCHLPIIERNKDIKRWLAPLQNTIDATHLLLHLLRGSVGYQEKLATDGFYQSSCQQNQLIRIKLRSHQGCYPTISGYKNRYAIRFNAWNEQPLHDIKFDLACC